MIVEITIAVAVTIALIFLLQVTHLNGYKKGLRDAAKFVNSFIDFAMKNKEDKDENRNDI